MRESQQMKSRMSKKQSFEYEAAVLRLIKVFSEIIITIPLELYLLPINKYFQARSIIRI